jgi:ArsR family transcriptional regulator
MRIPSDSILSRAAREREQRNNETMAQLCAALSHTTRVSIARLLRERGAMTCGAIVAEMPLAQSTVSQHLKTMKDSGLLETNLQDTRTVYTLSDDALDSLGELLRGL